MRTFIALITTSLLTIAFLPLTGCEEGTYEDAGEQMDEAVEETRDEVEDMGDEIEDELDDVDDDIDPAAGPGG